MPLEAPFAAGQRLPYVPPVPKPDSGGPMFSSGASALDGIGPAAAAASAIIAPSPGGIAGYTSVNLPGLSMGSQGPPSIYSSSYAGPYSFHDSESREPPSYQGHIHSHLPIIRNENWAPSSLPSPRRGPPAPDSVMAHHHRHHHHHPHHDHDDDMDRKSDASYYAMPKDKQRSHAGSIGSVSDSKELNDSRGHRRRSRSISQGQTYKRNRSPSLPPGNVHHLYTPLSSSPLAVNDGEPQPPGNISHSALVQRQQRMSLPPEEKRGPRLEPLVPPKYEDPELRKGKKQDVRRGPSSYILPGSVYHHSASPPSVMCGPAFTLSGLPYPSDIEGNYRRRAVSMQGLERPELPSPGYQIPSMTIGQVVYDDSASVASDSRMTFADGAVGGRTSQYGLPRYPHQPKVDYRRFCVQRGNADVFLD
ncbi:hypothetical protein I307_00309 [Cryptococcus deuterogattii 99/473]|uniref:Uncharacterized protein n=1 Tax=Cryptococcus deuterogattii Ram5 TaxID=1296110 RepID=A0A0D0TC51_9TREE|nr:hypothetical protein I313_00494 [Cryptococcus deuterogattii Ram5]KIY60506.1 hypothetical protein I307_00309 [Cryptococcus deuterogattii 99/473]